MFINYKERRNMDILNNLEDDFKEFGKVLESADPSKFELSDQMEAFLITIEFKNKMKPILAREMILHPEAFKS